MRTKITTYIFLCIMALQMSDVRTAEAIQLTTMVQPVAETCEAKTSLVEMCMMEEMDPQRTQELIENALTLCFGSPYKIPYWAYLNAEKLMKIEEEMGVPSEMRGMTLAAACVESTFNSKAEGDHKFSKDKKTPVAIGILQLWPNYEKEYKIDRRDVESSARAWLKRIKGQVKPAERMCKTKSVTESWRVAWVTGVRAPKHGGRCKEYAIHWSFFKHLRHKPYHKV